MEPSARSRCRKTPIRRRPQCASWTLAAQADRQLSAGQGVRVRLASLCFLISSSYSGDMNIVIYIYYITLHYIILYHIILYYIYIHTYIYTYIYRERENLLRSKTYGAVEAMDGSCHLRNPGTVLEVSEKQVVVSWQSEAWWNRRLHKVTPVWSCICYASSEWNWIAT